MRFKNGFSFVEVMIAAAALAGVALIGMQLMKSQTKSTAKTSFTSESNLIMNEIVGILSDPDKCLATLGGKSALNTTSGINSISSNKYFILSNASAPATGYGNEGIKIISYTLNATAAEVAANNSTLTISYQLKNILKTATGPQELKKKINLYVKVDTSNNITFCRSLSSSSTDIWSRGNGSDVFYEGGNVGIGTDQPYSLLHLVSDGKPGVGNDLTIDVYEDDNDWAAFMQIRNRGTKSAPQNLQNGDPIGGLLSAARINNIIQWTTSIKPFYTGDGSTNRSKMIFATSNADNLIINEDGKLGVKTMSPQTTLDVAGEVKVGNTGIACSGATSGAMRYNGTSMQYCDGTNWKAMGGNELKQDSCYWTAITTHGNFVCPVGYYVAGICTTNAANGCNPAPSGAQTEWHASGGVYCCRP